MLGSNFLLALGLMIGFIQPSHALIITATGMPDDYILRMGENTLVNNTLTFTGVKPTGSKSDTQEVYRFDIPDQFIQTNKKGEIDLWKSLQAWRSRTGRALGNPYTDRSAGVAHYPYYTNDEPLDIDRPIEYIALGDILQNQKKYPDLKFESSDTRTVSKVAPVPKVKGLVTKLNALKGKTIDCSSESNKAEVCLVCNCEYESGAEPLLGQIAVNRSVLTRVVRRSMNICSVVWEASQFSWTFDGRKKRLSGASLDECIGTSIEAVKLGTWEYDHFHNRSVAPGWSTRFSRNKPAPKWIGDHKFYNGRQEPTDKGKAILNKELGAQGVN